MSVVRTAIRNGSLQHYKLELDRGMTTQQECDVKVLAEIARVAKECSVTNRSVFGEVKAHFHHLKPLMDHLFEDKSDDTAGSIGGC